MREFYHWGRGSAPGCGVWLRGTPSDRRPPGSVHVRDSGNFCVGMNDLKYRGFTFDLRLADTVVSVNVSESEDANKTLTMVLQDGYPYPLQIGRARETPNKAFRLRVMNMSDVRVHSGGQSVTGDFLREWTLLVVLMITNLLCSAEVHNVLY